jgi:hypothetical protein
MRVVDAVPVSNFGKRINAVPYVPGAIPANPRFPVILLHLRAIFGAGPFSDRFAQQRNFLIFVCFSGKIAVWNQPSESRPVPANWLVHQEIQSPSGFRTTNRRKARAR